MRILFFVIAILFQAAISRADVAVDTRDTELVLSVDWEGDDLREVNLSAMSKFRDEFPEVRLVHFLNAAYFTKGEPESEVREKIQSVLRPGDELGLHIHGWESLFMAAGVRARPVTSFWSGDTTQKSRGQDWGHDAVIEDYSVDELRKVIRFSVETLGRNGFKNLKSFRTGGWMGGAKVLEALVHEGFVADSSAVPTNLLEEKLRHTHLYRNAQHLWHGVDFTSTPFLMLTPAGPITEYPNTGGLADYVGPNQIIEMLEQKRSAGLPMHLHYGFHQETASHYILRVRETLLRLKRSEAARGKKLKISTLRDQYSASICRAIFN